MHEAYDPPRYRPPCKGEVGIFLLDEEYLNKKKESVGLLARDHSNSVFHIRFAF